MKHAKYTNAKYYITFLNSEVPMMDSNCSNVTGSETAQVFPEIQQFQKVFTIQKALLSTNFYKIQGIADTTNNQ